MTRACPPGSDRSDDYLAWRARLKDQNALLSIFDDDEPEDPFAPRIIDPIEPRNRRS